MLFDLSFISETPDLFWWTTKSGYRIALPDGPILEFASTFMAKQAGYSIQLFLYYIRTLQFFIYLRFTMQFFLHVNPYDGNFVETLYNMPMWYLDRFRGLLPNLGGLDLGLLLAPWILDRVENMLGQFIIIDAYGVQY